MSNPNYLIAVIIVFSFAGCVESEDITAVRTSRTDWVPEITVIGNNYHRFEITISPDPDKEIHRNLSRMIVELKKQTDFGFVSFDTISVLQYFQNNYVSPASLSENESYTVRISAEYWNGVVKKGNEVSFTTPVVKGKIVRTIAMPQTVSSGIFGSPQDFDFSGGDLFMLQNDHFSKIDTLTGNYLVLSTSVADSLAYGHQYFERFNVYNDSLVLFRQDFSSSIKTVRCVFYSLTSLEKKRFVEIPFPDSSTAATSMFYDSTITIVWWYDSSYHRIIKYSTRTMAAIDSSSLAPYTVTDPIVINGELWGSYRKSFDNRIRKVNFNKVGILEEHRNPVFRTLRLKWDGQNFWTFDYEASAFSKLQLNGL